MRAVVYHAPRTFRVETAPDPVIGPDDVLIRVTYCGVCHTDVNVHEGEFFAAFPLIPGHEIVGTVADVGGNVSGLSPGTLVVADNTWTCGHCYFCRRGMPLFCENFYSLGINGPGGQAELVRVHSSKVFPVEDLLTPEQAVFVEPLACAVAGRDQLPLKAGMSALVFGAGSSAILLGQLLRHGGASRVVAAAPAGPKLDYALATWADNAVPIPRDQPQAADDALRALAPRGFEIVVDATGSPAVQEHALNWVQENGTLLLYGMARFSAQVHWNSYTIFRKQIRIQGSFAQIFQFPRAIALLAQRRVIVEGAISQVFALDQYDAALQAVRSGAGIKTVVAPSGVEPPAPA